MELRHSYPLRQDGAASNRDYRTIPVRHRAAFETLESRQLLAAPWGGIPHLIELDTAAAHYRKVTGKGQTVAVIDTGVDYNHPALGGRWGKKVIGGYDFVNRDSDPMDETGHGTAVAGVLVANPFTYGGYRYRGMAPGAKVVALRVEDNSGYVPNSRIEEALRWVINNRKRYGITSVNMSFGDGAYGSKTSLAPYSDELASLKGAGVFIAAASGNEGVNSGGVNYPAADPSVVSVGSVNVWDIISGFTSRGASLEVLAPGENVPTPAYDYQKRTHVYVAGSGTSFATPMVAGAALLLKQVNPNLSAKQILKVFKAASVPNYDGDKEAGGTRLTYARINIDDSITLALKQRRSATRTRRADVAFKNPPPPVIEPAPAPRAAPTTDAMASPSVFNSQAPITDSDSAVDDVLVQSA